MIQHFNHNSSTYQDSWNPVHQINWWGASIYLFSILAKLCSGSRAAGTSSCWWRRHWTGCLSITEPHKHNQPCPMTYWANLQSTVNIWQMLLQQLLFFFTFGNTWTAFCVKNGTIWDRIANCIIKEGICFFLFNNWGCWSTCALF